MDEASLRRQLTAIRDRTDRLASVGSWWVGDTAGERRRRDDVNAGRFAWLFAYKSAKSGLQALDRGETETASTYLTNAIWSYIDALELRAQRLRPKEKQKLARPAGRRGRPMGSKDRAPRRRSESPK